MKNAFYFIIILSCFGCQQERFDLNGFFFCDDYGCAYKNSIGESVEIVHSNGKIKGTKITGDDCMPAGSITFKGVVTDDPKVYQVTVFGTAENGETVTFETHLYIKNNNAFYIPIVGLPMLKFNREEI